MTNTDNLKRLHENLIKKDGFNVPFEQFQKDMQDENKLKSLHSNLAKKDGFSVPYEQFKVDMWGDPQQFAPGTTASQDTTLPKMNTADIDIASKQGENRTPAPQDPTGWEGTGRQLGLQSHKSAVGFNQILANTPEYLNRISAWMINKSPMGQVVESIGSAFGKDLKLMRPGSIAPDKLNETLEKQQEYLTNEIKKVNSKYEQDIFESAQKGDWITFARNLAGGVAESFAPSLAMMVSGGALGTAGLIAGGSAVFGAGKLQELDKMAPDMDEDTKMTVSIANGTLEGIFETLLGSGAVGSAIKKILTKEGLQSGTKIIQSGIRQSFADLLTKYPALAPLGEGFEEFGTQVTQNIVDKYSGYRPDIKITDGAVDAFLVGTAAGGLHTAPLYLSKLAAGSGQPGTGPTDTGNPVTPDNQLPVQPAPTITPREARLQELNTRFDEQAHDSGNHVYVNHRKLGPLRVAHGEIDEKGNIIEPDGTFTAYTPDGKPEFVSVADIIGQPKIVTRDQFLADGMAEFDKKKAEFDLANENAIEFEGKRWLSTEQQDEAGNIIIEELDNRNELTGNQVTITPEQLEQAKAKKTAEKQVKDLGKPAPVVKQAKWGKNTYEYSLNEDGTADVILPGKVNPQVALSEIQKHFENNPKFTAEPVTTEQVIPAEDDFSEPTSKPIVTGVRIVPRTASSNMSENAIQNEGKPAGQPDKKIETGAGKYKFGKEAVSFEEAQEMINLAESYEELKDLKVEGDPGLLNALQEKFKPVYTIGGNPATEAQVRANIRLGKNIQDITIENNYELSNLLKEARKKLPKFGNNSVNGSQNVSQNQTITPTQSANNENDNAENFPENETGEDLLLSEIEKKRAEDPDYDKKIINSILDEINSYNNLSPFKRGRYNLVALNRKADVHGLKVRFTGYGSGMIELTDGTGKPIKGKRTLASEKQATQEHKGLNDYDEGFKNFASRFFTLPDKILRLPEYKTPMNIMSLRAGIRDIQEGKKTASANYLLDALEDFYNKGEIEFKPEMGQRFPGQPIEEFLNFYLGENKTEDLTPEEVQRAEQMPEELADAILMGQDLTEEQYNELSGLFAEWAEGSDMFNENEISDERPVEPNDQQGEEVGGGQIVEGESRNIEETPGEPVEADRFTKEHDDNIKAKRSELAKVNKQIADKRKEFEQRAKNAQKDIFPKPGLQEGEIETPLDLTKENIERIMSPYLTEKARLEGEIDNLVANREQIIQKNREDQEKIERAQGDLFGQHEQKKAEVDQAAAEVNTNPTEGQKEAGNYKKGHITIQGMDISIENPAGSVRSGTDSKGNKWETPMNHHYGYFTKTTGKDGDHIDTFINPESPESGKIFVVDQNNEQGEFDESKVMLGFNSPEEAKSAYLSNYTPGWNGFRAVTEVPVENFKKWLYDGARQRKPFAEYKDTPEPAIVPDAGNNPAEVQTLSEKDRAIYNSAKDELESMIKKASPEDLQNVQKGLGFTAVNFTKRYATPDKNQSLYNAIYKTVFDTLKNSVNTPNNSKEPWQMTKAEYVSWGRNELSNKAGKNVSLKSRSESEDFGRTLELNHKEKVRQALSEGKPVPENVLAEYPELNPAENKTPLENAISVAKDKKSSKEEVTPEFPAITPENALKEAKEANPEFPETPLENALKEAKKKFENKPEPKETQSESPKEFRYKMLLRPFGIGTHPKEGFVKADQDTEGGFQILTYDRKLDRKQWDHFSLLPLTDIEEIKGKEYRDKDGDFTVNLEWLKNSRFATVTMKDKNGELVDDPFDMSYSDILENIETGYWVENKNEKPSEKKEVKDEKAEELEESTEKPDSRNATKEEWLKWINSVPREEVTFPDFIRALTSKWDNEEDRQNITYFLDGKEIVTYHSTSEPNERPLRKWYNDWVEGKEQYPESKGEPSKVVTEEQPEFEEEPIDYEDNEPVEKLEDFGEKIGGARKDMDITRNVRDKDSLPAWRRKFFFANADGTFIIGGKIDTSKPFLVQFSKKVKTWRGEEEIIYTLSTINTREPRIFTSEAEAEAYIPIYEVWKQNFKVRKKAENFIIVKTSSTGKDLEYATFPTEEEANTYMYSTEGATSLLNHKREDFSIPKLDKVERTGKNWRKGKDVSTEEFMSAFGFRGGEFGNWVKPEERRVMLNAAYDSFMDLAELLNLPPRALSLEGNLSIAFGARGVKKYAAHYEPGRAVINLTRMNGAGSLAHEWAHALDNYFGLQDSKKDYTRNASGEVAAGGVMLTNGRSYKGGMRAELEKAFSNIVEATQQKTVTRVMGIEEKQKTFDKFKSSTQREADTLLKKFQNGVIRYQYNRKTKKREDVLIKATPEQLNRAKEITDKIVSGEGTNPSWSRVPGSKGMGDYSFISPETLALEELYKEVFGYSGLKRNSNGFYNLGYYANKMYPAKDILDKATSGESETLKVPTDYYTVSKEYDKSRANPYWGTKVEMFARAFEYFIETKLTDNNQRADYLQYDKAPVYDAVYGNNPYPAGEERADLNKLFEQFFNEIKTVERDGRTIMYRSVPTDALPDGIKKVGSFKTEEGNFSYYDVEFQPRGRAQYFTVHELPDGWVVRNVILPESERGKGIATRAYEYFNQESLRLTGNPLKSSRPRTIESTGEEIIELSNDGMRLWDRLVREGKAIKTGDKQYEFKPIKNTNYKNGIKPHDILFSNWKPTTSEISVKTATQKQITDKLIEIHSRATNAGPLVIASTEAELREQLEAINLGKNATEVIVDAFSRNTQGFYHPFSKVAVINSSKHNTVDEAVATWLHEIGIHRGLENILPKEQFNQVMEAVYDVVSKEAESNPAYKTLLNKVDTTPDYKDATKAVKGEELLAFLGEKKGGGATKESKSVWKKIMDAIRKILAKLFGVKSLPMTARDIEDLVTASIKSTFQGEKSAEVSDRGIMKVIAREKGTGRLDTKGSIVDEPESPYGKISLPLEKALKENAPTVMIDGKRVPYHQLDKGERDFAYGTQEKFREAIESTVQYVNERNREWIFGRGRDTVRERESANESPKETARITDKIKRRTVLKGFKESGYVNFNGLKVSGPADIADLFSIHRSPHIEKFHAIYLKGNKIVGVTSVTSGSMKYTDVIPASQIVQGAQKRHADGVYMVHNHPSGNYKISDQDAIITHFTGHELEKEGIKLYGHVVIDHDKFSLITPDPSRVSRTSSGKITIDIYDAKKYNVTEMDYKNPVPRLFEKREKLPEGYGAPERIMEISRAMVDEGINGAVLFLGQDLSINAYDIIPDGATYETVKEMIEDGISNYLGSRAIVVHNGLSNLDEQTYPEGTLDVVNVEEGGSSYFETEKGNNSRSKVTLWDTNYFEENDRFELDINEEPEIEYQPRKLLDEYLSSGDYIPEKIKVDGVERHTRNADGNLINPTKRGIENFWKWFGESKVVDEQGRPLVVYHSSPVSGITEFIKGTGGTLGDGIYLTRERSEAEEFGADNIYELYARIINPANEDIASEIESIFGGRTSEELKRRGYDGVDAGWELSVFDANQLKSASGNNGGFTPDDPNILHDPAAPYGTPMENAARKMAQAKKIKRSWAERKDGMLEFWKEQDLPLKRFQEKIIELGGKMDDNSQPYRQMTLAKGRLEALWKEFQKDKMGPIKKAVTAIIKAGLPGENILGYVIAKHAPERNADLRQKEISEWTKRNIQDPANMTPEEETALEDFIDSVKDKDYAGVMPLDQDEKGNSIAGYTNPDELANDIVAEVESKVDKKLIDNLWDAIRNAGHNTIDTWVASKTMSEDEGKYQKSRYNFFVPLRGWREGAAKQLAYRKGEGFSTSLKHAEGRGSLAENPLAYIEQVAFKALGEQVDNEVKEEMLNLFLLNDGLKGIKKLVSPKIAYYVKITLPDGTEEWEMARDVNGDPVIPPKSMFDSGDAKMKVYSQHERLRASHHAREHEVLVKGKNYDVILVFPNQYLSVAHALNHQNTMFRYMFSGEIGDAESWNQPLSRTVGVLNNFLKAMYTSFNVVFPVMNIQRDFQEGTLTQWIKGESGTAVVKNYRHAMPAIIRDIMDKSKAGNKYDDYLKRFGLAGGSTGFTHLRAVERIEKDLNRGIDDLLNRRKFKGAIGRNWRGLKNAIETWNRIFEDSTRLSVFISAVENGKTDKEAASMAKEATINFNRKGKITKTFDALWAFFNVALESMYKNFGLAKKYPARFTAVAAGYMASGFIMTLLNDMLPGDDDDDYYNVSDYARRNYIVLPNIPRLISKGEKGDKYLRLPLSQFWRGFYSLGSLVYDITNDKITVGKAVPIAVQNFLTGLLPVDISGVFEEGGPYFSPLAPTVTKPIVEVMENRNFLGETIYKEPFTQKQKDELSNIGLAKNNVNAGLKFFTDMLYDVSGGEPDIKLKSKMNSKGEIVSSGWIDINPSIIEHLLKGYSGGTGGVITDAVTTAFQIPRKEFDFRNAPFVNAFVRKTPESKWKVIREFYDLRNEIDKYPTLLNAYKNNAIETGDTRRYINAANNPYYREYRKVVDTYEKLIDEASENVNYQTSEGTDEVINLMKKANEAMRTVKAKHKRK